MLFFFLVHMLQTELETQLSGTKKLPDWPWLENTIPGEWNDNNTLQTALGIVGDWTVGNPKCWDLRNPFFSEGATLHLLLIKVNLMEILFPQSSSLWKFAFELFGDVVSRSRAPIQGVLLTSFMEKPSQ